MDFFSLFPGVAMQKHNSPRRCYTEQYGAETRSDSSFSLFLFLFFLVLIWNVSNSCFLGLNQLGVVVDCQSESMSRHSMFPSRRKDGEVIPSVACRPFPIITIRSEDIASSLSPNTVCSRSDAHPINGRSNSSICCPSMFLFLFFSSFYRGENGQEDWLWNSLSGLCELFPTST